MLGAEPDTQLAALRSGLGAWSTFEIVPASPTRFRAVLRQPQIRASLPRSLVHHGSQDPMKEDRTMTRPTDIDRDAPVIANHEIDITAPLDTVWSLHTRVNAWPSWNQEMTGRQPGGPVRGRQLVHVDQLRL